MDLTCRKCGARFRAAIEMPLTRAVRVQCPACTHQMVLKPSNHATQQPVQIKRRRVAVIADEPRPFRAFLADQLRTLGFEVSLFETGEPALDFIHRSQADLVIVNVYLKGKLGVEIAEDIKNDPSLDHTRVILIGALFRANRFRANPTNLYGADEYIEEAIPEREFRQIIHKFFAEIDRKSVV